MTYLTFFYVTYLFIHAIISELSLTHHLIKMHFFLFMIVT